MQLNAALVHVRHFIKKHFTKNITNPKLSIRVCVYTYTNARVILNIDKTLIEQRHREKRA